MMSWRCRRCALLHRFPITDAGAAASVRRCRDGKCKKLSQRDFDLAVKNQEEWRRDPGAQDPPKVGGAPPGSSSGSQGGG